MKYSILLIALGLWGGRAAAEGFSQGDVFTYTEMTGVVHLTCLGHSSGFRSIRCNGYSVTPVTHDYFVIDEQLVADRVELQVTRPNGKVVKKKIKFDSKKQRSKKPFNLSVQTLFQKPLLHLGNNDVRYRLTAKNKTVREGSFRVRVNDAGLRQCRGRSMTSHFEDDCRFGGTANTCRRYFESERYCDYGETVLNHKNIQSLLVYE